MFVAVILGFRNEIYGLDLVNHGYTRSYTGGVRYVRSYTMIEGASPRSATHLATNGSCIYPCLYGGYIRYVSQRYSRKIRDTVWVISTIIYGETVGDL